MVSNELEKAYQQKCLGKEEQILIEKIIDNYAYGHTTNYLYLKIPNNDYKENEIYPVTVKEEYFDTTNNNVTIEV